MVTLEIDIKTVSSGSRHRKTGLSFPSSWEELTEDQFMQIIDYLVIESQNPAHIINVFADSDIQVYEEVTSESVLLFQEAFNKYLNLEHLNRFILQEFKRKKIVESLIINHSFEALSWGLYYYKRIVNNIEGDPSECLSDYLRLAACFFSDNKEFKKEQTECFISDSISTEEFKKVAAFSCNFGLVYKWLKIKYPYAFKLAPTSKKPDPGLSFFQVLVLNTPAEFNGRSLDESLKRINLLVKEYILHGVAAGSKVEAILRTAKN